MVNPARYIAERLAARAPGDQLRERLRDEIAWHDSHHSEHMAINRLRAVLEETP